MEQVMENRRQVIENRKQVIENRKQVVENRSYFGRASEVFGVESQSEGLLRTALLPHACGSGAWPGQEVLPVPSWPPPRVWVGILGYREEHGGWVGCITSLTLIPIRGTSWQKTKYVLKRTDSQNGLRMHPHQKRSILEPLNSNIEQFCFFVIFFSFLRFALLSFSLRTRDWTGRPAASQPRKPPRSTATL